MPFSNAAMQWRPSSGFLINQALHATICMGNAWCTLFLGTGQHLIAASSVLAESCAGLAVVPPVGGWAASADGPQGYQVPGRGRMEAGEALCRVPPRLVNDLPRARRTGAGDAGHSYQQLSHG